jgi:hypothetical protein
MLNLKNCVVCGSPDNLNTELTITVDDQKIKVAVCDNHADDITPKAAREAYADKKSQIDAIIAQAKALGLEISEPKDGGKVAIAERTNESRRLAAIDPTVVVGNFSEELRGSEEEGIVSTRKVDAAQQRVRGVGGVVQGAPPGMGGQVEQHNAHDRATIGDKLPSGVLEGKVKLGLVEGRGGQPVAIQEVRQDGTGITRTTVNQGKGDAEIQRRFKELANSNIMAPAGYAVNQHGFAVEGYNIIGCTFCHGTGNIQVSKGNKDICPKCKGSGIF